MKKLIFIMLITLINFIIAKSQNVTIKEFNKKSTYGKIDSLKEDSIALLVQLKYIKQFDVEEIEKITVHTGKGNNGISTILGVGIGMIPGIVLLNTQDLGGVILGLSMIPTGGIIGGIIGNKIGKSGDIEIPIFGNKKLYRKQKEKIREFSY